jgi:hypothetical protein
MLLSSVWREKGKIVKHFQYGVESLFCQPIETNSYWLTAENSRSKCKSLRAIPMTGLIAYLWAKKFDDVRAVCRGSVSVNESGYSLMQMSFGIVVNILW